MQINGPKVIDELLLSTCLWINLSVTICSPLLTSRNLWAESRNKNLTRTLDSQIFSIFNMSCPCIHVSCSHVNSNIKPVRWICLSCGPFWKQWGFTLSLKTVDNMMMDQLDTKDSDYDVACRWLQSNEEKWKSWLPERGKCFSQFGMYDASCLY